MLKVTDNVKVSSSFTSPSSIAATPHTALYLRLHEQCLKYKTYSSIILNRFEALNLRLLTSMASPRARAVPVATPIPAAGAEEVAPMASEQKTGVDPAAGTGKGASKKKKKGKK